MKLLSGRICAPSTAARGVASFIASLEAIPANPSRSPGGSAERGTSGTCGRTSRGSCGKRNRSGCFSKTSSTTFVWDSGKSRSSYETWATGVRRESLARRKSARRIFASGCSRWPTARAEDGERCGGHRGAPDSLTGATRRWQTPTQDRFRSRGGSRRTEEGLDRQARNWPTPAANDAKTPGGRLTARRATCLQSVAVLSFRRGQTTRPGGSGRSRPIRQLNPRFVEGLMGLPAGWTDCAPLATQWFHWWQRMHSERFAALSGNAN